MGIEDTAKRSKGKSIPLYTSELVNVHLYLIAGFFSTKVNLRNRSTTFTLGSRDSVITTDLESPIIVVPHAQKGEKKVSQFINILTMEMCRANKNLAIAQNNFKPELCTVKLEPSLKTSLHLDLTFIIEELHRVANEQWIKWPTMSSKTAYHLYNVCQA